MTPPPGSRPPAPPPEPVRRLASGPKRVLYLVGGLVCVGLAYLGAILPGLPTTQSVLLAGDGVG
jgi:hypothetical protein